MGGLGVKVHHFPLTLLVVLTTLTLPCERDKKQKTAQYANALCAGSDRALIVPIDQNDVVYVIS